MRIKIGDIEVSKCSGRLTSLMQDKMEPAEIMWGIELHGELPAVGETCEIECVDLLRTQRGEVRVASDLAGRNGKWAGIGTSNGDTRARLTIWEHEEILDATWRIELAENGLLRVFFRGQSYVDAPPEFGGSVEVLVEADLAWSGFPCGFRDVQSARAWLDQMGISKHLNLIDLDGNPHLKPES